ncbi:USP6_32 [Lepeophtheirus salmonis]|uniref:ubiquitinyl hydrolase 1 n=1 Tax=Lepeophtheirus salmonis TaxID=72036 RepID=A0A7R8CM70_LEPSM|nr:USP6_32 [Lepeophtheirus salmonis]CAF2829225.1 USP6_32 [Lepeophtheirus salmonis]
MGGKESKQFPLSSEEALKRVTEGEKRRLQDAFRRLSSRSNVSGLISKYNFVMDVLGDIVPSKLADRIYTLAVWSSSSSANAKGLNFREILSLLVLITRGTREEKIKMMFGLLTSSNGVCIEKSEMFRLVREWERDCLPHELQHLFAENYPDCLGLSKWLLTPTDHFSLVNKLDTPTFYQTLAGVTHLDEEEIVELEKRFWTLTGSSHSGQIDLNLVKNIVSPPLPDDLAAPFFHALDENEDGHIDLKELSCGVSAACRGPELERQKFVFKMFDLNRDGVLNEDEFNSMITLVNEVYLQLNKNDGNSFVTKNYGKGTHLTLQEFLVWTTSCESGHMKEFSKLLYQLCHVCLGLKPLTRSNEGDIVRGWIEREEKLPHSSGSIWNLVSMNWWIKKKLNAVASNHSQGVVATGYSSISDINSGSTTSLSSLSSKKSIDESNITSSANALPLVLLEKGLDSNLKIQQGKDFELVPKRLWEALILWYGDAGVMSLPRQTILNSNGVFEVELYPIAVKIMKHQVVPRPPQIPTVVGGYSAAAIHAAGNLPTTTRRYIANQAMEDMRLWFYRDDLNMKQLSENECRTLEDLGFRDDDGILVEVRSRDGTWPEEISSLMSGGCHWSQQSREYMLHECCDSLNRTNPLGMKGHIAKRFGDLVRDMWSGEARTIAPIKLRWTIGRYRQHFSGFQQQDSQELLAFLLDDSDGRPDDEVAAEAWESHSARNKSIIVDLFHGQLKSKVTCKVCGHESVRFDPFTYLSLPLPMESSVHIEVIVIRQNGSIPTKYGLTLDMDSKYTAIRNHLTKLCRIPAENLILVDVVNAQFRVPPSEEQKVKNMNGTCIFAYEFKARPESKLSHVTTTGNTQTFSDIQRSRCTQANDRLNEGANGHVKGIEEKSKQEIQLEGNGSIKSNSVFPLDLSKDLGDCQRGIIVGLNRKMIPQESYFLSTQKYQPVLFGLPLIINFSRLVSPLPPRETTTQNHALDCDDSLKYEYPFVLKVVQKGGSWCHWCPWHRFCRGCVIPCNTKEYSFASSFIAIDWDQTALHLRYRSTQEKVYDEDYSVQESLKRATEPITLGKCLQAFTREEQLGSEEKYYCSICETHQLAAKKLQIWKLPPILIVHLKRFHYLNAAVPSMTLKRFKHLKLSNSTPDSPLQTLQCNGNLSGSGSIDYDDDDVFEKLQMNLKNTTVYNRRTRQESTSLNMLPVIDDNLRDFHQHRLMDGSEPLDIKYNMYGMVCHSGVLGGGHYTSYTKHSNKWYLNNDSTCKEVQESQIDKSSAYMLFL